MMRVVPCAGGLLRPRGAAERCEAQLACALIAVKHAHVRFIFWRELADCENTAMNDKGLKFLQIGEGSERRAIAVRAA